MNNEYLHFFCKNRVSTLYFGTDIFALGSMSKVQLIYQKTGR